MNNREIAFCESYLVKQNSTQAAIDAGYAESTARQNAHSILTRPHIQEYLGRLNEKAESYAVANATTVINGYAAIASASPLDCLRQDADGLWIGRSPEELPEEVRPAIARVHIRDVRNAEGVVVRQTFKYELYDRMAALLQLGKHFQVFGEAPVHNTLQLNQFSNVSSDKLEALASAMKDAIGAPEVIDGQVLSNA